MKKKILIIEDNYETQLVFKIFLRELYEIEITDNAEKGLDLISAGSFDLVLLDINLPGRLDGNDVLRIIKQEQKSKLPILVVTAYAMKGDREKFLQMGADDYLTKPVEKSLLLNRISLRLTNN